MAVLRSFLRIVGLGCFVAVVGAAPVASVSAQAKENLVVSARWAAFSEAKPHRCYAVTMARSVAFKQQDGVQPALGVVVWPERNIKMQLYIKLSSQRQPGTPLRLHINGGRFDLVSAGYNAWAADAASDQAFVDALRMGGVVAVVGTGRDGKAIRDVYSANGAATAIDAARLGCLKP